HRVGAAAAEARVEGRPRSRLTRILHAIPLTLPRLRLPPAANSLDSGRDDEKIRSMTSELVDRIQNIATEGRLLPSAVANLRSWIESGVLPDWALASIEELLDQGALEELNNR